MATKDPTELRYKVPEFYFKSAQEMEKAFADYDFGLEAIENTMEVAENVI